MTDYTELGKRLVACKGFRWMAGMRAVQGARLISSLEPNSILTYVADEGDMAKSLIPDLSDAATRGCVIHLVRELWPKEKWKQLGRSHSEIVKKLTWLSGPESEAEVLVSLIGLAGEDKE